MQLTPLLGLCAALLAAPQDGAPPPASVQGVRAVERSVAPRHLVTGSLAPARESRVGVREAGILAQVPAREGRSFRKGDVLAELDDARLLAERLAAVAAKELAEAELVKARAESEAAAADLRAVEQAVERGAVSDRDLRDALARAQVAVASESAASARIESSAAELALIELRISEMKILAPFDGIVLERFVEVGEWVEPGAAVCALSSNAALEVRLDVPERLLPSAGQFGDQLELSMGAGGLRVAAERLRVVPRVDVSSRTFRVLADVAPSSDQSAGRTFGLSPGMSVSAYLPGGPAETHVLVPKDALVYRPNGLTVTVVQGADEGADSLAGAASPRSVEIAFEVDRAVALRPGAIQPGEVVVVEGNERLFPGTPVQASISPFDGAPAAR